MTEHSSKDTSELEKEICDFGSQVFKELDKYKPGILDIQYITDRLMEFGMREEAVKVALFRFVDVLPALTSPAAVIEHVQEYFSPIRDKIPTFLKPGLSISPQSFTSSMVAKAIRKQVEHVAERFIVGESAEKAIPALRKIRKNGTAFTVDLVGEATVSETEAEIYKKRYLELLTSLANSVKSWPESQPLVPNHRGEHSPINISVKPSALYSQIKPVATNHSVSVLCEQMGEIFSHAMSVGAFVYVDMEDCSMTSLTLQMFRQLLDSNEFRSYPHFGIVLQAYLRRTASDLDELIDWVKLRKTPIGVRLVKGAYWDTETILAKQHGWEIPVWQKKSCSDANYEKLTLRLLDNHNWTYPAFGSHNIRSLTHACMAARAKKIPTSAFELQTLYGMADPIKKVFCERGYLVREYSPVGELLPGMGYLVRRLLENTSNEGFLRASFHEKKNAGALLVAPSFDQTDKGTEHLQTNPRLRFSNSPLRDFTLAETRLSADSKISETINKLGKSPAKVAPIVAGKKLPCSELIKSIAPENPNFVLAEVALASEAQAIEALNGLHNFFPTWRKVPIAERAGILFKAAELMEQRRDELTALIRLEAGKPILDADADVAEAIDFLNYYALEAIRISNPQKMGVLPGEVNSYFYEPRGVTLVISPWNFPLAIPCGMLCAALVTGNVAILKPAEQTSLIASELFQILLSAGLPPQAASFLPGIGETVGAALANNRLVSTICFTGSKEVGLSLIESGANRSRKGEHVCRVISEMGGKNAIIVDTDADLDEAVRGVVQSAFGYQGQKCSACSRVIVLEECYDKFCSRLQEAVSSLLIGPTSENQNSVGPVIDEIALSRIAETIAAAKKDCKVLAELPVPAGLNGYFISPVVFTDIPDNHPILSTEIFGPVLAVQKATTFEQAVALAMDSDYGLTGAVFSRSPKNIDYAVCEFRVGNLYLNRGCTGALVYRHPFGGAKMSGVGAKAGGPDYLLQFLTPRSVSENTLRRGFAPEQ